MTEEEKLRRGAEIRAAMKAEMDKRSKMTPDELKEYSKSMGNIEPCAAPLEEQ